MSGYGYPSASSMTDAVMTAANLVNSVIRNPKKRGRSRSRSTRSNSRAQSVPPRFRNYLANSLFSVKKSNTKWMKIVADYVPTITLSGTAQYFSAFPLQPSAGADPMGSIDTLTGPGYTQFAALFGRVRVNYAVVDIYLTNLNPISDSNAATVVFNKWFEICGAPYDASLVATIPAGTAIHSAETLPFAKFALCNTSSSTIRLRFKIKPWKVLGVSKEEYMKDEDFSSTTTLGQTPARFVQFQTWLQTNVATGGEYHIKFCIWQKCEFFNPKNIVQA